MWWLFFVVVAPLVVVQITQRRYNVLISEPQGCWRTVFQKMGQSQARGWGGVVLFFPFLFSLSSLARNTNMNVIKSFPCRCCEVMSDYLPAKLMRSLYVGRFWGGVSLHFISLQPKFLKQFPRVNLLWSCEGWKKKKIPARGNINLETPILLLFWEGVSDTVGTSEFNSFTIYISNKAIRWHSLCSTSIFCTALTNSRILKVDSRFLLSWKWDPSQTGQCYSEKNSRTHSRTCRRIGVPNFQLNLCFWMVGGHLWAQVENMQTPK